MIPGQLFKIMEDEMGEGKGVRLQTGSEEGAEFSQRGEGQEPGHHTSAGRVAWEKKQNPEAVVQINLPLVGGRKLLSHSLLHTAKTRVLNWTKAPYIGNEIKKTEKGS